jgi:hypothetical protein
MTIRVTHMETGAEASIGPVLDATTTAIIAEVYQGCSAGVLECREHDNDPKLEEFRTPDGRVHGVWVYLRNLTKSDGSKWWVVSHSPNGVVPGVFRSHEVQANKSDQHRWQQDYYERAARDAGYDTKQEDGTVVPGRVVDVRITGPAGVFAIEVQHSFEGVRKVRHRHAKGLAAGVTSVWSADHRAPDWAFRVPHVETNKLEDGVRPRGSWTVTTGPRTLEMATCSPGNFQRCPERGRRNFCGRWHPTWLPKHDITVDDIAQMVPAGQLVVLDTSAKQGTILVTPRDREVWLNELGLLIPQQRTETNPDNHCAYQPNLKAPATSCVVCGQNLLLIRPGRDTCARCGEKVLYASDYPSGVCGGT